MWCKLFHLIIQQWYFSRIVVVPLDSGNSAEPWYHPSLIAFSGWNCLVKFPSSCSCTRPHGLYPEYLSVGSPGWITAVVACPSSRVSSEPGSNPCVSAWQVDSLSLWCSPVRIVDPSGMERLGMWDLAAVLAVDLPLLDQHKLLSRKLNSNT